MTRAENTLLKVVSLGNFLTAMNFRIALAILSFLGILRMPIHAGWMTDFRSETNRATIGYSNLPDKGHPIFDDALSELSKENHIEKLDLIAAFDLMKEDRFQKELFSALERDAPRELKEALASAGNMHNPKMAQLDEPFRKAVLMTPVVRAINVALAVHGMTVSRLNVEKFQIRKDKERPRFFGILWLTVTKLPNQALEQTLRARQVGCRGAVCVVPRTSLTLIWSGRFES